MKFGLFHTVQWPEGTEQRDRMREGLAQAVHAEELGFHSLWMTEHHFTRHGITADNLGLLAYLAASTERMRLGSAVSVLPFHNPLRLAEAAATVDLLSDGRFDFGVGRGYQWTEYHGFGVDIEQGAARFEESLELILRAWGAEAPFDHHGDFWDFDDVNVLPRPFQHPHPPVWVATASAAGFRRCAERGWGVMLPQGLSFTAIGELLQQYRDALADAGQPYDPQRVVLARALYVAQDDNTAWETAGPAYAAFRDGVARLSARPGAPVENRDPFDTRDLLDTAIFGGPDTCAAKIERLQEMGIGYVIFFDHIGGLAHRQIIDSLDRFAGEVAPRFPEPPTEVPTRP